MEEKWRRSEPAQSSRKKRGRERRITTRSQFSLSDGGMARLQTQAKIEVDLCKPKKWKQQGIARSSRQKHLPGKCEGPKWLGKDSNLKLKRLGQRHGEENRPEWRSLGVVQEVFGVCSVPIGATADESLQTRKDVNERERKDVEKNRHTRRRKGARQKCWRVES